jgi:DNA-binding PadR family transcriptional regulator
LTGEVYSFIIYYIKQNYLKKSKGGVYSVSIASDLIRGHTETIILAQLLQGDSYGYEINKFIQEKTKNQYELKEATLYSAFRRLENAGLIESYWGDQTTGARRRYYKITKMGTIMYEQNLEDWKSAKTIINLLIGMGNEDE